MGDCETLLGDQSTYADFCSIGGGDRAANPAYHGQANVTRTGRGERGVDSGGSFFSGDAFFGILVRSLFTEAWIGVAKSNSFFDRGSGDGLFVQ